MMSNFPDLLAERLSSTLKLNCLVTANSNDQFSDLLIRSAEIELQSPNGWEFGIEVIASKIFMEFRFDDSAKTLNSFYEARINEVSDAFWGSREALVFDGFSIQIFSGSTLIENPTEMHKDSRVGIKCSVKTNVSDSELIGNMNEFFSPVIRFVAF